MLDRIWDISGSPSEALEPLPRHWRELFDSLREQLARSVEQRDWLAQALERTSLELREQVVELEALRRARSAAESSTLIRGEILATLSRSMRMPADALLGLTRLLRLGPLVPSQRAYAEALHGAVKMLRGVLNDVSDYSRLESGTLPLEPMAFDLRVMLEDLAAVLGGEAQAKGILLRFAWRPESPRRVTGDPGRLRQILATLVRDGLSRLTQGEILLEIGEDAGRSRDPGSGVRVIVEDSGPGIPADLLPTLFEPFMRGDAYAQRDGGLALPIARQLAHLMGGDLAVENPETGAGGSRFTLRLPLVRRNEDLAASSSDSEACPPTSALPGALLVVDADPNQRAGWATVAEAAGYRAIGAATREEARGELGRRADAGGPVEIVIFSDHGAEEYEQIGREIGAEERLGKPALIMLPAVGNPGDARRLREAGFRGYLVKPVAPADLRETLETLRRTRRTAWHRLFLTRHSLAESRQGVVEGTVDQELEAGLERLLSARTDPPVTGKSA